MRWAMILAVALLAASLAGCGAKTDETSTTPGAITTTATSRGGTQTGTQTTTASGGHSAQISADVAAGTAPLEVTFGLASSEGAESWTLSFGDGSPAAEGDAPVPASQAHTYTVGGNFTATLTVTFDDAKTAADSMDIQIGVPDAGPAPESHFEYGPALGCEGSVHPGGCASFVAGPDQEPVDGHWQPVDSRYWGVAFTTTIDPPVLGDSDCYFVADDEATILGDASNGSTTCGGTVPSATAWIFIYSYVEPQAAMTMDFEF